MHHSFSVDKERCCQQKIVAIIGDGPEFYVIKILAPTLSKAFRMLQEDVNPKKPDKNAKGNQHPSFSVGIVIPIYDAPTPQARLTNVR